MIETIHAAEWFVSTLEGDTGVGGLMEPGNERIFGVYHTLIPEDVELPAVRIDTMEAHDVRGAAAQTHRIMTQADWLVVVTAQGHRLAEIVPIVDRVDSLLHEKEGETATVRILSCIRVEPFDLLEVDSGVQYRHVGGLYRTLVQPK